MKTRFAPSPTGYIHIGNVRSAIYPYLLVRQENGTFILRIEDTDQARFVEGATELIEDTLNWLGLEWDEGPIVGGPAAPYFQSKRGEIYHKWGQKLIDTGHAYADPTDSETIQKYRDECNAKKIPYLYRNFRPENPPEWKPGIPLRFKADPKPRKWHDEVVGDLEAGPEVQDDIILIKADGMPTYNFAHIVDDAEMGVTHVMRGVEYLSSTPNYLALYEALNLEVPKLVSLPHILAPTGNKKLGKRDGAKSATEYRADGVLPEAMLNYLACLGWNDGTEQEIYTKDELIKNFSLEKIQNSGARYDETKLLWMNGQWIRRIADEQGISALYARTVSAPEITSRNTISNDKPTALHGNNDSFWPESAAPYDDEYKQKVLAIIYDRLKTLSDLKTMTTYFFENPTIDLEMITGNKFLKKFSEDELSDMLMLASRKLEKIPESDWNADNLQAALNELLEETGKKPAELFSVIRIALSFAPFSPALHLTMNVLGKNLTLSRLQSAATALEND